jgi:signal transduction histidine kinase/CheY-like chemotaxis protein
MSTTQFDGATPEPDHALLSRLMARAGVRLRLLTAVAAAAIPALAVLAFSQYTLYQRDAASALLGSRWYDLFIFSGGFLLVVGALFSLGIGIVIGERFLRRPTEALVNAAEQWSAGHFDVRIDVGASAGAEFGRIAGTFNRMAEALGQQQEALARQQQQLQELNASLERGVASRTDELSESHRRLLAEIAERERAENKLRQSQKLQAVGHLAGGIAHDFNNLLTTVVGALDLLRGRLAAGQESMVRLVDSALTAAERGSKLTSQLLAFSRRQRLAPVPTDMNAAIIGMADLLRSTLGRGIFIETDLATGLWPAMVDPSQVEAAILNLAINARDAMPEGGSLTIATCNVSVEGRVTFPSGDYVAIQVTDTGCGMSEEIVARAFEPFFTTKEPGRGSGLGLSQVHGLAVQSGGDVRIRSVPGEGTTVSLLLPRAVAAQAPAPEEEVPLRSRARARILVVDDDAGVLEMTSNMLSESGFAAVAVDSAEAALLLLEDDPDFDLLLTDFVMPGMNGLRLMQEVAEHHPGMRAVLMTGYADLTAADPIGQERVLQKPFNIAQLDERICRALGRPRLQVIQGGMSAAS